MTRCPRHGRFASVSYEPHRHGQHRPGFVRLWHGALACAWYRIAGPPTPVRLFPFKLA